MENVAWTNVGHILVTWQKWILYILIQIQNVNADICSTIVTGTIVARTNVFVAVVIPSLVGVNKSLDIQ